MNHLLLCLVLAQSAPQTSLPEGTALITGRVIDGVTKSPVSAAVVTLGSPGASRREPSDSVITDGDGRFFFDRVAKGNYALTVSKPGWIEGAFGRRRPEGESTLVAIKDDELRPNVELRIWKRSVLSGAVLDEAGDPVVDVLVWAVRRNIVAGRPQMQLATAVRTDDRGAFRLSGLVPDDYTVFVPAMISSGPITFSGGSAPIEWYQTMTGVGAAPMSVERETGVATADGRNVVTGMGELSAAPDVSAPWMTLPPTFFGGSGGTATFVHLDPGQDRQGITIAARRVPTQSISGTLTVPGGTPASHALHLLPAQMADFPLFDLATAITDARGTFTFYGVPAGSYVIRVVKMPAPKGPNMRATTAYVDNNRKFVSMSVGGGGRGGPPPPVDIEPVLFAQETVAVGDTPVRGLALTLRPGIRISGRAEFVGTAPQPAPDALPRLTVSAGAANGFAPYMTNQLGRFDSDGTFTTPSLLPGQYVLTAGTTSPWRVKSVTAGGVDVTDVAFDASSDVTDVVVTYTDRAESIRGTVTNQTGPDDGASVLMFPAQSSLWMNYGRTASRLRTARTSASGTFTMPAPPPGDYLLIALPEEQIADWRDPAMLAKLSPLAQRVTVRDGESPTVNLKTGSIK